MLPPETRSSTLRSACCSPAGRLDDKLGVGQAAHQQPTPALRDESAIQDSRCRPHCCRSRSSPVATADWYPRGADRAGGQRGGASARKAKARLQRPQAPKAGPTTAPAGGELVLPTHCGPTQGQTRSREAVGRRASSHTLGFINWDDGWTVDSTADFGCRVRSVSQGGQGEAQRQAYYQWGSG